MGALHLADWAMPILRRPQVERVHFSPGAPPVPHRIAAGGQSNHVAMELHDNVPERVGDAVMGEEDLEGAHS